MPLTAAQDIADLLNETRTIALVGISDRPDRPSYSVMKTLQDHGYRVLPVNPQIAGEHVHGEFVWDRLSDIGVRIDMVDIFRRSEAAGAVVDQAIAAGANRDEPLCGGGGGPAGCRYRQDCTKWPHGILLVKA